MEPRYPADPGFPASGHPKFPQSTTYVPLLPHARRRGLAMDTVNQDAGERRRFISTAFGSEE